MTDAEIRNGMPPVKLSREEFERRYKGQFLDPVFVPLGRELEAITAAAWDSYSHSRKVPLTRKAGAGVSDPDYDIAIDWLDARARILEAQRGHDDTSEKPRIFVINGALHSEHKNAARALGNAVHLARSGRLQEPGASLADPNPK